MFTIAVDYNWLGVTFSQKLPVSLPVALRPFTPTAVTHEETHSDRTPWFTTGFL